MTEVASPLDQRVVRFYELEGVCTCAGDRHRSRLVIDRASLRVGRDVFLLTGSRADGSGF